MTRNGKIARLPLAVRQQLNQRLQNGELARDLLSWLNRLPESRPRETAAHSPGPWRPSRVRPRRRPGKPASTET